MALTLRIGGESSFLLLPPADGVRVTLMEIKENKFRSNAIDLSFNLIDTKYENGSDEDTDEAIKAASADNYTHFETATIPNGPLGKTTKLYKLIKGMNGGRDIDEGDDVDLEPFVGQTFLADFEQVDKQKPDGSGGFVKAYDDKGNNIKKAVIVKIRPEKKAKAPKSAPITDTDLFVAEPED